MLTMKATGTPVDGAPAARAMSTGASFLMVVIVHRFDACSNVNCFGGGCLPSERTVDDVAYRFGGYG